MLILFKLPKYRLPSVYFGSVLFSWLLFLDVGGGLCCFYSGFLYFVMSQFLNVLFCHFCLEMIRMLHMDVTIINCSVQLNKVLHAVSLRYSSIYYYRIQSCHGNTCFNVCWIAMNTHGKPNSASNPHGSSAVDGYLPHLTLLHGNTQVTLQPYPTYKTQTRTEQLELMYSVLVYECYFVYLYPKDPWFLLTGMKVSW